MGSDFGRYIDEGRGNQEQQQRWSISAEKDRIRRAAEQAAEEARQQELREQAIEAAAADVRELAQEVAEACREHELPSKEITYYKKAGPDRRWYQPSTEKIRTQGWVVYEHVVDNSHEDPRNMPMIYSYEREQALITSTHSSQPHYGKHHLYSYALSQEGDLLYIAPPFSNAGASRLVTDSEIVGLVVSSDKEVTADGVTEAWTRRFKDMIDRTLGG
jgi:hypothetical protein